MGFAILKKHAAVTRAAQNRVALSLNNCESMVMPNHLSGWLPYRGHTEIYACGEQYKTERLQPPRIARGNKNPKVLAWLGENATIGVCVRGRIPERVGKLALFFVLGNHRRCARAFATLLVERHLLPTTYRKKSECYEYYFNCCCRNGHSSFANLLS